MKVRPPNWINFCQEFEVMKFVQQIIIRKLLTDKLKSKNYIVSMTFHHQLRISTSNNLAKVSEEIIPIGGTRMGLQEEFSCLIYLFLGTQLGNFRSDTKISLFLPQFVFGISKIVDM